MSDFGVSRQMETGTTLLTKAMGTLCWMNADTLTDDIARYKKSSHVQVKYVFMKICLSVVLIALKMTFSGTKIRIMKKFTKNNKAIYSNCAFKILLH